MKQNSPPIIGISVKDLSLFFKKKYFIGTEKFNNIINIPKINKM